MFTHASGGRKITEDISEVPNVLGTDEVLNGVLKITDTQVYITAHAQKAVNCLSFSKLVWIENHPETY